MLDWIKQRIEEIRYACYLWYNDEQPVGFETTDLAMRVGRIMFNDPTRFNPTKITSDAEGKGVLFEWRVEDREWYCSCKYRYSGWYDVKAGYLRSPIDSIIYEVGKQDDHFHGVIHVQGGQLSSGYMPAWSTSIHSALPKKEDNGDPLE